MLVKFLLWVFIIIDLLAILGGLCIINESRSYCFMCGTKMYQVKSDDYNFYICSHCGFTSDVKWHYELLTKITELKRKLKRNIRGGY